MNQRPHLELKDILFVVLALHCLPKLVVIEVLPVDGRRPHNSENIPHHSVPVSLNTDHLSAAVGAARLFRDAQFGRPAGETVHPLPVGRPANDVSATELNA